MKKIDDRVIALFDRCTTLLQRRAWLPLNTLIMGTECLFWSVVAVGVAWWWVPICALALCIAYARWRDAHGYWENYRKAQELNARVLRARDERIWRLTNCFLVMLTAPLAWGNCVAGTALVCMGYLRCCRYLGPGDFAREKRESLSGLPQEG